MTFFDRLSHEFALPLKSPVLIFSLLLFIILITPLLLKRLKIPGIIGLIISGVIIGPNGLGILAKTDAIELFSVIGLLYITFIAGLELDINDFRKNKYKSILFGAYTFAFPFIIGLFSCRYLLGYNWLPSVLTASMFSTHTMLAYPIVTKFGIVKNQAVAITVGGTIITDTAVLLMLSVINASAQGSLSSQFWITIAVSMSIFLGIMFFVIPLLARWFFTHLEGEKTSHYIFVLSMVFFAAFLAEVAGIEKIVGAFAAGLALNRLVPHSSVLMNRIEFVGYSIFIPVFLVSVGMMVDISVLTKGTTALTVAGVLSVMAIFGKWLAAFFTRLTLGYSVAQQNLIFGLSGSRAAAALAVVLVGYEQKIVDENILNGTIFLILVSCIVASFSTEAAAKRIVAEEEKAPKQKPLNITKIPESILIPVANPNSIGALLDFTLLIKSKVSNLPINFLSIVDNDEDAEANLLTVKQRLADFSRQASSTEVLVNTLVTIDNNVSSGIIRTAKETIATTLVMGWPRKESILDKVFGPRTEMIVNSLNKNIFLCHIKRPPETAKRIILVCTSLAHLERGFTYWLKKICTLAKELSLPVLAYCTPKTQEAMQAYVASKKISVLMRFHPISDSEEEYRLETLSKGINEQDVFIIVSARKDSISYEISLENIPHQLHSRFSNNTMILVYPMTEFVEVRYDE
jgi:Kef-type K+ transport system membrane component KefB